MKKLLLVLVLGMTMFSCSKEDVQENNLIDTLIGKTYLFSENSRQGILFQRNIFFTSLGQMYGDDCFTIEGDNEEFTLVKSTLTEYWITLTDDDWYMELRYSKGTDGGLNLIQRTPSGNEPVITLYEQSVVICD
tara:strand:+ start:22 stop:423 length:402 start_codon:yes stop_codon:yes gene_type:complete